MTEPIEALPSVAMILGEVPRVLRSLAHIELLLVEIGDSVGDGFGNDVRKGLGDPVGAIADCEIGEKALGDVLATGVVSGVGGDELAVGVLGGMVSDEITIAIHDPRSRSTRAFRTIDDPDRRALVAGMASKMYALPAI